MKQTDKNKSIHIVEGVIAIVILAGLVWFIANNQKASAPATPSSNNSSQSTETPTTPTSNTPATNQPTGVNVVYVSTQTNGSKVVTIDNISLTKPSFVIIEVPGDKSTPDQIIGTSKLLTAGEKQDLEIPLTVKLSSKSTYKVLVYQDNGDKKFNAKTDIFLTGKNSSTTFNVAVE